MVNEVLWTAQNQINNQIKNILDQQVSFNTLTADGFNQLQANITLVNDRVTQVAATAETGTGLGIVALGISIVVLALFAWSTLRGRRNKT